MPSLSRAVFVILSLAWIAPAVAAEERPVSDAPKDKASWLDARASELRGKKVVNPQGKSLGEVKDVIVDARKSSVEALALSSGGVGGLGDKVVLVPPRSFTRGEVRDRLVLDMDEKKLQNLPSLEKSEAGKLRASDLMGRHVSDKSGKAVGEIEDLVINLGTGRVEQVVLAPDGRKAPEQKRTLPMSAFTIPAERGGKILLR